MYAASIVADMNLHGGKHDSVLQTGSSWEELPGACIIHHIDGNSGSQARETHSCIAARTDRITVLIYYGMWPTLASVLLCLMWPQNGVLVRSMFCNGLT